ncbi:MAG: PAS domain S-box protein, partial [Calditrichaeota bacterium]|nr:PAS domain S-box protein [Calditrichota bacterium]
MTGYDNIQFSSRKRFRRYLWMLIAIATFIIASILVYVSLMDQRGNRKIAIEEARIHLKTSQAFRYWGVSHGGVYVPTDENTPPSPYLSHIEERDITTPSGIPLTLMNPAYMVRQMHEDLSDIAGVTCRITSLKPLRKENAPDDWERAALQALELDSTEVTEFIEINGNLYLRLMIPMIVEKSCLKCHGDQGYKIGDIRGGVVVSYPMKQILVHEREHINTFIISFGLLWLISIAGIIIGIFYMKRRVDQRDRIQHALQESEERYRKIVESTNACLFSTDNRGRFTFINDGGSKVLGYPQEQLIGRFYLKFIHPEDKKRVHEVYISQLKTGKITTTIEFRYIDSSGRIGWLVFIVNPMIVNGEIVGFNGVAQEITDRKRMEQMQLVTYKIADSVNTTKDIYELFNSIRLELGVIIDTKNFFIALYDEEKDMISLPLFEDEKDSFTEFPAGKTMTSYVVKNDKPLLATYELQLKMVETGKIEAFGTHSKVWLGVPLKSGGKVTGAVVVQSYEDSSAYSNKDLEILQFVSGQIATAIERKQAEEAIQKSEHKYRLLAETAKDVIMVLDLKGYFIYINPEGLKLGGFSEDEAHGMNITDIIPDDQFPFVEEEFARRAAGEGDINVIELEIYNKAKVRIPVEIKSSLIIEDGKPTGVLVFARDITERKLAEQALRESEEKFRSVIQQSNDCIILIDIETLKVIDANPAFGRLLGYTDDEVLNLRAYDYLAHDKDDINRAIQQVLFEQHVYIGERQYIRKDGSTIGMDVNANHMKLGERKVICIVSRDITERK